MTINPGSFRDSPRFRRARTAEQMVAAELRRRGWYVVPSYDYQGEEDKAPRLQGRDDCWVVPDLDVCRDGTRRWVEVKTKAAATWTRKLGRWEHGFDLKHYHHYCRVRDESGCKVWICVYEEDTGVLLIQDLAVLEEVGRTYNGGRMGLGGMFFFPRSAMMVLPWKLTQPGG